MINHTYSLATATSKALLPDPSIALPEPEQEPITKIFSNWAAQIPAHPAIIQDSRTWTYGELAAAAEKIAQILQSHQVKTGDTVAVTGLRSFGLIASILGVLMSGGVLVNIASNLPQARQQLMLTTAKTKYLLDISTEASQTNLKQASVEIITINPQTGKPIVPDSISQTEYAPVEISGNDSAYIFFTSGTTGKPKGVLGCHKGLSHFLNWQRQTFEITPQERGAQLIGLSFDGVLRDIFLPLTSGATLCLPSEDDLIPGRILSWIEKQQISLLHTVPTLAQSWLMNIPPGVSLRTLRRVFFVGEPLTDTLIQKWREAFPQVGEFINLYGPTETTLIKCYYRVPAENILPGVQPVGSPLPQTQALVLTPNHQLCGIGESGEIVIRTPFRSKGYINASAENLSKFVKNPFREDEQDLLYYTGDRGRYRPNGSLEILGRVDHQVKIRGVRIEPGEIGVLLDKHPKILANVVIAREDVPGEKRLVAYYVPNKETAPTTSELREFLKQQLPDYMVPSVFVSLEALPLTPNGKVDRRALPAPNYSRQESEKTFVAPGNELEVQLTKIWEKVLGVQPIGIRDNFFELGGHSLLATQVISRLQQILDVNLPMHCLFESPTVAALSKLIESNYPVERRLKREESEPVGCEPNLPLSFGQESLWFLKQLGIDNDAYSISTAYHLQGQLNVLALSQSWNEIVRRHEALRTTFTTVKGQPIQVVHPKQSTELPVVDLQNLPENERQVAVEKLATETIREAFDLTVYPLWRVKLIRLAEEEHLLLVTIHQIVCDEWSWNLLFNELAVFYTAFSTAQPLLLPELQLQYADFACWQRQWLQGENLELQLNYWQQQLEGSPPLLKLPTDRPRPPVISYVGETQYLELPKSLTEPLKELSRKEKVTLFMTLLAAFQTLLYRYSGQLDMIVGTPIAGRNQAKTEKIIGFFVNTLVLRTDLSGNPTFLELLGRVRETALGAYDHQDLPFEKLVELLLPERSLSYNPLFQVMFVLKNAGIRALELSGLTVTPQKLDARTAKFDLTLELEETPTGIKGFFEYRADLFDAATINRMVEHFQTLLTGIIANPELRIGELPLLTASEQQQLFLEWNNTSVEYPRDRCIHQLIEDQVERNPEAVAVTFKGQHLTYRELNIRANQLAHYLRSLGVDPDVLVGICVEPSLEMAIGFLGIFKAGGAYVPLDPSYPPQRLAFMLEDSQVLITLTQERLLEFLPNHRAKVVCLDTNWQEIARHSPENPVVEMNSGHLAYVIYTSGTTGKPKGVMITHQGLVNHNLAIAKLFTLEASDRMLQFASISFDIAVEELFPSWISGATVVLREQEILSSSRNFLQFVEREHITILDLPTAFWHEMTNGMRLFGDSLPICVRLVVVGGEKASRKVYSDWLEMVGDRCRWINAYGPTETTVTATFYEPAANLAIEQSCSEISIGRPIANTQIYILDQQLQPVPIGVPGELHIGGAGLARGYLNCLELTRSKFIPNPFINQPSAYLYKTGDLVRYLSDGNIEFIGRIDNQVKIRGFRIELGEIETAIRQNPKIKESIIIVREDIPGDKRIVSYVVTLPGQAITNNELRSFLKAKLSNYMIPSQFVILDALPLTPNSKLDWRALPTPNTNNFAEEANCVAPRTSTEAVLANIWSKVLGLDRVSIHDNFFDLGGHSLLVTRVIAYSWEAFSVELSLRQFFTTPTIAGLSEAIDQSQNKKSDLSNSQIIPQRDNRELFPLSFTQQRLWFLEQLEPNRANYHICIAVRLTGPLNIAALQLAVDAIVARHEILRTNFICKDGNPTQVINPPRAAKLALVDLQGHPLIERETEIERRLQQERQRSFNLAQDLMLRGCLLQVAPQEHMLLLVIHHIACDGWSLNIFCQELNFLYTAFCNGLAPSLPALPIQYGDFSEWQRQQLSGQNLENQLKYWKQQLADADHVLELPTDYFRPLVQTYSGASQSLVLNQSLTTSLKLLSRQQESTLFMVLMAAFQLLLYRYSGQEKYLVGFPLAGRNRTELEGLIGCFVSTLVLRANLSGNPSFRELLSRVREMALGAYSNQDLPFEKLVKELQIKRDLSRNPLFQVWFNMLNFEDGKIELQGLTVEPLLQQVNSKFDLTLYLQEKNQEIELELVYNTNLFVSERMTEMLKQFEHLLNQIVTNPIAKISELSLMTSTATAVLPNPQKPLLSEWTGAVHTHFSQQAQRVPQQLAVVDAVVNWNYAELEERSNLLANYLLRQQIQSQDIVAIYAHRNAALVWAILGVLKAGAAFVILDPAYPASRLINYLETSQPRAFLQITAAGELPKSILETLESLSCRCRLELTSDSIELVRQQFQGYGKHNPGVQVEPDDLAYVAFTSGSTGVPKGILGMHRPLPHFLQWHSQTFGFNQSDRFSLLSGLSHDPLLRDIFTPLTLGATLCIPQQKDIETPGRLAEWMVQQKVTVSHITPPMIQILAMNSTVTNISQRYVFFGGDRLTAQDVEKIRVFAPNATCVNFYGATETPQAMGYFVVPTAKEQIGLKEIIPIGKGIADVQLLVLNQQKQLAGIGELGEIYVRTPYLTKGYIGNGALTSDRFIINPFTNIREDRLYKTGDLGRYLPNGDVEFLGRSDDQVKIRGFRIELAEIEALLSQHFNVQENVVIAREDELGNKHLVAYIVTHAEPKLNKSELRDFLKKQLPDYMVPSAFVMLDALPLTPNGKIDRLALPAPEYSRQELENTFVAPSNELEIQLTKIWEKVLGVQPIGIRDNFFELGGHSLIAVHLVAEIEKIYGISLPLATLFRSPTVEELANSIRTEEWSASWSLLVPIQLGSDTKPPLFCIHPIGGHVLEYYSLAKYLGEEQTVYGLQAQGLDGKEPLTKIEDMANHYIKEIRTIQPKGPYFLIGYSFGGIIAFEIAQQLYGQGQQVGLLALIDARNPKMLLIRPSLTGLLRLHLNNLWQLEGKERLRYIKDRIEYRFLKRDYKDFVMGELPEMKNSLSYLKVLDANIQAREEYTPQFYPGLVNLFRCQVQPGEYALNPDLGWSNLLVGHLKIHDIPGEHIGMLKEPRVQKLAIKLKFVLKMFQTHFALVK